MFFLSLLAVGVVAHAQEQRGEFFKELFKELQLTDQQRDGLKGMAKSHMQTRRMLRASLGKIRGDGLVSMSDKEFEQIIDELRSARVEAKNARSYLESNFTAEQQRKLHQARMQFRKQREQHKPGSSWQGLRRNGSPEERDPTHSRLPKQRSDRGEGWKHIRPDSPNSKIRDLSADKPF